MVNGSKRLKNPNGHLNDSRRVKPQKTNTNEMQSCNMLTKTNENFLKIKSIAFRFRYMIDWLIFTLVSK